jgi:hypothetical protein
MNSQKPDRRNPTENRGNVRHNENEKPINPGRHEYHCTICSHGQRDEVEKGISELGQYVTHGQAVRREQRFFLKTSNLSSGLQRRGTWPKECNALCTESVSPPGFISTWPRGVGRMK